ncbi:MAG: hypothetical protein IE937_05710 [Gammaproteobacteria bacterium]|nr:hypothetical protein [Gammaproteobacteria bacterium]
MKIKVGIVGQPLTTVTLYLDEVEDSRVMKNWNAKNTKERALAYARRTLGTNVFPIEIDDVSCLSTKKKKAA